MDSLFGRPKANNFEPSLTRLLHSLASAWDTESFAKNTESLLATIQIDGSEMSKLGSKYHY